MNRKYSGLPARKKEPPPRPQARRWRHVIVLFALLGGMLLALVSFGPRPADPNAGVWDTVAYRVEKHYSNLEESVTGVASSAKRLWRRGVLHTNWNVDTIVLVGGILVLAGCLMMSRRVGR